MVYPRLPGGFHMAVTMVLLMVLSLPLALTRDFQPRFLLQAKSECHFSNGTQRLVFMERRIHNQEEYLRFDSSLRKFIALTELGRPEAETWNKKASLEEMAAEVDRFCRHNYEVAEAFTVQRRVKPVVTVYPTKTEPLQHHNLLVCAVHGFYPGNIEVRWLRNGHKEEAGVVSTGLVYNGDWTFQIMVMLEMTPQQGDVYTCHVEHPSLDGPVTVQWKPQSGSAQGKMMSGVGGFVLGLLFLGAGLFVYFRNS
ncbi:DLA class II histocompatibility antigen, DR-1 beta chain-like [Dipodomys spectabilis]|uniref:DLA class II histocompatibility antigen, DR-1 beta chain-like n=1 Tax=Dipodomys spectabilis TaxID=105255 RepID=UPI001C53C8C6|nr:DLA class II histocompatibility antigen, DR-1 beta chain-like [Dipodomys spectabilis]XP_042539830.1 DLA class II histocompatibility antigen, DR-1 beta chain-like [Dipodomys spectabilis]XP_042539831.1 DLA class II histocompatibility antigen, DR-1 beta chain-like [Dipodomys spectabilis]